MNEQHIFLTKDVSAKEISDICKKANNDYFLGYFNVFLKTYPAEGVTEIQISEPKFSSKLMPDEFYFDYQKITDPEGWTEHLQNTPISPVDAKVYIASPHRQQNNFMWYVKNVMTKAILEYCGQEEAEDDGVGWFNINEVQYHTPSQDEANIREQFKNMKCWWRYSNYSLSKTTMKKFGLKKMIHPEELKSLNTYLVFHETSDMSGVFKKWGDIYNFTRDDKFVKSEEDLNDYFNGNPWKKNLIYAIANNNFVADGSEYTFRDFSKFDPQKKHLDYIDNSNPNVFLYFRSNKRLNEQIEQQVKIADWTAIILIKNKFYPFPMSLKWHDEIGNQINEQQEIWYDPLLFVIDTDLLKAQRLLKLKKIEK